ncbi:hypothetical protein PCANC_12375 [Puccinia coronata f. sp. avenae]|uniref:FHA domain-containing protein n=1 Tax=Puccinia coronata f. sp. avenae TaxID=200324 RepID=A0A2N5UTP7_9BASI|nr:hypothetical protein PCANC_12375 [Puccinia coronata f. sp. avenae]PLW50295.1 hypothetical protein PCASD_01683 [Puccinia coronata f. sp. avenae]
MSSSPCSSSSQILTESDAAHGEERSHFGDALGFLSVLSAADSTQPRARLTLRRHSTTIGSCPQLSAICLEDPLIQPLHLMLNIVHTEQQSRASLHIVGASGIRLNGELRHACAEPISLQHGDTFHISQFPFRWEQHPADCSMDTTQPLLLDMRAEEEATSLRISATSTSQEWTFHSEQRPTAADPTSHVSFQRRSYRTSVSARPTRSKSHADQWSDDEDDEDEPHVSSNSQHHLPSQPPTTSPTSPSPSSSSSSPTSSPSSISDGTSPNLELSPSQSRPKSLLQKILIKQAVQVHITQHTELNEPSPAASSGFSSSDDDDDNQEEEDPDSNDEEGAPPPPQQQQLDNEMMDNNSSDEDKPPLRMPAASTSSSPPPPSSSSSSRTTPSAARDYLNQPNHPTVSAIPAAIFSAKPRSISSASHFNPNTVSLPSTITRPFFDRRSISPNAKLLSSFENERSSDSSSAPTTTTTTTTTTTNTTTTLVFPLKSSFRKKSYSPQELLNFSHPPSDSTYLNPSSSSAPISRSAHLATVRHNTQLNSRSPSFPLSPAPPPPPPPSEEVVRSRLRSSLRASATASSSSSSSAPPNLPENKPAVSSTTTPHRIIRTPRSFLIKLRGSLTPLTAPVCGQDPTVPTSSDPEKQQEQANVEDDYDYDHMAAGDDKRKVRFDREVFCLEFEQLPEELPLSRQKKRAKKAHVDGDEPHTATADVPKRNGQRRNNPLPSGSALNNRPRRHSPRLPPPSITTPPLPTCTSPMAMVEDDDNHEHDHVHDEHEHAAIVDYHVAAGSDSMVISPASPALATVDMSSLSINACSASGQQPAVGEEDYYPTCEEPVVQRGSMIETLTARLFPVSEQLLAAPCVERRRGNGPRRRASLPSDLGRLGELQTRLGRLSLSASSSSLPGEPGYLLSTPLSRFRPVHTAISFPPSLAAFSPRLTGLKQLFMGPTNTHSSDDEDDGGEFINEEGEKSRHDMAGPVSDGLNQGTLEVDKRTHGGPITGAPPREKPVRGAPSRRPARKPVASEPKKRRGRPPSLPPAAQHSTTSVSIHPAPAPDRAWSPSTSATTTTTTTTTAQTSAGPTLRPRKANGCLAHSDPPLPLAATDDVGVPSKAAKPRAKK